MCGLRVYNNNNDKLNVGEVKTMKDKKTNNNSLHDAEAPIPRPRAGPYHGLPWPGRARPSRGNLPFLWRLIARRSRLLSHAPLSTLPVCPTHRPAEYDRASAVIIIKLLLWHTNRLYCSRVIVRQCFQLVVSLPAPPPPSSPPRALCLLLLHFAQMKNVAVYFHLEFFYCGGGSGSSDGALNIICCINVGHMHMKIGNTQRTHTHIHSDLTHTRHIHSFCLISM